MTLTSQRLLTRQGVLRRLTREFNRLPHAPSGPVACPSDDGSEIDALLAYARDRAVTIEVRLTGCQSVTNGSVSRSATQRLIDRLERLAGSRTGQ